MVLKEVKFITNTELTSLQRKKEEISFYAKPFLTIEEGVAYFGIGRNSLIEFLTENDKFVLLDKSKRLIKKNKLENYLNEATTI